MAKIVQIPGKANIIGKSWDKLDAYFLSHGLTRVGGYQPQYDKLREQRINFTWVDNRIPYKSIRGVQISGPTGNANYTSGSNLAQNSTYTGNINYPLNQSIVIYVPPTAINDSPMQIYVRYDVNTRAVLDLYEYNDAADTWFNTQGVMLLGAIADTVEAVGTGGASATFNAVANAGVSVSNGGSVTKALVSVGSAFANAPTVGVVDNTSVNLFAGQAPAVGGTAVADYGLDASDYASTLDPFSFSDAEASTAISDAQNVDFGLPIPTFNQALDAEQSADPITDSPNTFNADLGATPEPSTGFGTNPPDGQFTSDNSTLTSSISKGLPVAVAAAKGAVPTNSQPANQTTQTGKGTNVQATTGPVSGPTAQGTFQAGSSPALATGVGVLGQIESMFSTNQTGQLKPNTGVAATGTTANTNFYLMVGLAFIAAAVLIKGKI